MITAICNECGRVWEAAVILGMVTCPECGSENVSVAKRAE
jgi:Zn finger protein HypA/HybF involved in hydrogenase expression